MAIPIETTIDDGVVQRAIASLASATRVSSREFKQQECGHTYYVAHVT